MTPSARLQTCISVDCLPGGMAPNSLLLKCCFPIWLSSFLASQKYTSRKRNIHQLYQKRQAILNQHLKRLNFVCKILKQIFDVFYMKATFLFEGVLTCLYSE